MNGNSSVRPFDKALKESIGRPQLFSRHGDTEREENVRINAFRLRNRPMIKKTAGVGNSDSGGSPLVVRNVGKRRAHPEAVQVHGYDELLSLNGLLKKILFVPLSMDVQL